MGNITVEIAIVLLLILINGVFAMSEIAVVSARRVRLKQRAEDGDTRALKAIELSENPNRFLSTVQVGITLIGILAGAYGGATIAGELSVVLSRYPAVEPYSDALGLAVVVTVITFLSLIVGELVPKRLALLKPESIATVIARPMHILSVIFSPVVGFLSLTTDLVLRVLRVRPNEEPVVTEEEIEVLLAQGAEAGVIEQAEHEILERLFRFGDQTIASFMTPRREVVCIEKDDLPDRIREKILEEPYSHFVVCQGGLDNPLGVVDIRAILSQCIEGKALDISRAIRQPLFVPESVPALKVLDRLRRSTEHVAMVVNEYGGIEGIVSMTDIMEAIVGEFPMPGEPFEASIMEREGGSWLVDGMLSIEEFKDHFNLRELPGEDEGHFRTVGGFVINFLGQIPKATDSFHFDDYYVEVMDMDGNRVDKVLIVPQESSKNQED